MERRVRHSDTDTLYVLCGCYACMGDECAWYTNAVERSCVWQHVASWDIYLDVLNQWYRIVGARCVSQRSRRLSPQNASICCRLSNLLPHLIISQVVDGTFQHRIPANRNRNVGNSVQKFGILMCIISETSCKKLKTVTSAFSKRRKYIKMYSGSDMKYVLNSESANSLPLTDMQRFCRFCSVVEVYRNWYLWPPLSVSPHTLYILFTYILQMQNGKFYLYILKFQNLEIWVSKKGRIYMNFELLPTNSKFPFRGI